MTLSSYKFQLERQTLLGTFHRSRCVQALRDCVVQTAFVTLAWGSFAPPGLFGVFSYLNRGMELPFLFRLGCQEGGAWQGLSSALNEKGEAGT